MKNNGPNNDGQKNHNLLKECETLYLIEVFQFAEYEFEAKNI